ncbi:MAG: glycerophosphodiester phosphodiesterase [Planctomycetes bacterium]|nr:glycerophosphodiester phosphodiesterase [Planctomycetota bacterium]
MKTTPPFQVLAHRGDKAHAPENTIPAFEAGLACGAGGLELDVRLTRDGVALVHHDADFKRSAGDPRSLTETPFSECQALDVGARFSAAFAETRVPTLKEVLERFLPRAPIDIELKAPGTPVAVAGLLRAFPDAVRAHATVTSFDLGLLGEIRALDGEIKLGWLTTKEVLAPWAELERLGARTWAAHGPTLTAEACAEAHARGLTVRCWAIHDLEAARRIVALGADGCTYDDPAELLHALRSI